MCSAFQVLDAIRLLQDLPGNPCEGGHFRLLYWTPVTVLGICRKDGGDQVLPFQTPAD